MEAVEIVRGDRLELDDREHDLDGARGVTSGPSGLATGGRRAGLAFEHLLDRDGYVFGPARPTEMRSLIVLGLCRTIWWWPARALVSLGMRSTSGALSVRLG